MEGSAVPDLGDLGGEIAAEVAEEVIAEVRRILDTSAQAWAFGIGGLLAYNCWRVATGRLSLSEGYDVEAGKHPVAVAGITAYIVIHLNARYLPKAARKVLSRIDILSIIATIIRAIVAKKALQAVPSAT